MLNENFKKTIAVFFNLFTFRFDRRERVCRAEPSNEMTAEAIGRLGALAAFLGGIPMFMGFALILITGENFNNARTVKSKCRLSENQPPAFAESFLYFIFGGLFCLGLSLQSRTIFSKSRLTSSGFFFAIRKDKYQKNFRRNQFSPR